MLVGQIRPLTHMRVASLPPRLFLTVCLSVYGCATVDGGAVELSWKLRPTSSSNDIFVDCNTGAIGAQPVTRIRLDWQVASTTGIATWNCSDYHGVTNFELPPGTALLAVSPECGDAVAATNTYTAPAPEQRVVIAGNTISLGAVELVVETKSCSDTHPCICQ
jgi:hypothetical protein